MTIVVLAIVAAVVAIAAVAYTISIAPRRTERVRRTGQRPESQGEQLSPRDRAS
jgi:peptidoglycan/LPS O-acetylase OafA/YrhL